MSDGEAKIQQVENLCSKTLTNTSSAGKEILKREVKQLENDWSQVKSNMEECQGQLEAVLSQWVEFDMCHDDIGKWMKGVEAELKDYELKGTLSEKQQQIEKFKVSSNIITFFLK